MNAGSDSAVELKQRGFLSRCCSTDRGRIITAVVTSLLTGFGLDPLWRMVAAIGESCIAYEWEYAVDLDGNAYSTLPDSIDPDKFSTMSWFTRQALYGKDDVAFYRLRN